MATYTRIPRGPGRPTPGLRRSPPADTRKFKTGITTIRLQTRANTGKRRRASGRGSGRRRQTRIYGLASQTGLRVVGSSSSGRRQRGYRRDARGRFA